MPVIRGTSNSNVRGNSRDRLARRQWLVETFRADADHYRCGCLLTVNTVTVDRIVPGCHGGKYVRNNIRPACGPCNVATGAPIRRTS